MKTQVTARDTAVSGALSERALKVAPPAMGAGARDAGRASAPPPPGGRKWIAPSRRPVCHPAAAVDQDEQTWTPQRAFSPRQGVLLGAGEGQGLVGGTSARCTLHAGCVAPSSECCPADTPPGSYAARHVLPSRYAARQIYCHTARGAQKTPGAWPPPCAWGSGDLPYQADLRVRRRPSRPMTETSDTNAAAPKVGTGVGLAGGTTVPLLRMVICAAGPSTV